MNIKQVTEQSLEIQQFYHNLERKIHGSEWSITEYALAFLSDAGLVGRLVMDNQGRWPSQDSDLLPYKIGESVWWLTILAERMDLDFETCLKQFLEERLEKMKK